MANDKNNLKIKTKPQIKTASLNKNLQNLNITKINELIGFCVALKNKNWGPKLMKAKVAQKIANCFIKDTIETACDVSKCDLLYNLKDCEKYYKQEITRIQLKSDKKIKEIEENYKSKIIQLKFENEEKHNEILITNKKKAENKFNLHKLAHKNEIKYLKKNISNLQRKVQKTDEQFFELKKRKEDSTQDTFIIEEFTTLNTKYAALMQQKCKIQTEYNNLNFKKTQFEKEKNEKEPAVSNNSMETKYSKTIFKLQTKLSNLRIENTHLKFTRHTVERSKTAPKLKRKSQWKSTNVSISSHIMTRRTEYLEQKIQYLEEKVIKLQANYDKIEEELSKSKEFKIIYETFLNQVDVNEKIQLKSFIQNHCAKISKLQNENKFFEKQIKKINQQINKYQKSTDKLIQQKRKINTLLMRKLETYIEINTTVQTKKKNEIKRLVQLSNEQEQVLINYEQKVDDLLEVVMAENVDSQIQESK